MQFDWVVGTSAEIGTNFFGELESIAALTYTILSFAAILKKAPSRATISTRSPHAISPEALPGQALSNVGIVSLFFVQLI